MTDPFKPSASLLAKLGSLIVHYQEALSSKGHQYDHAAIATLETDPEVFEWLIRMDGMSMIPRKRT